MHAWHWYWCSADYINWSTAKKEVAEWSSVFLFIWDLIRFCLCVWASLPFDLPLGFCLLVNSAFLLNSAYCLLLVLLFHFPILYYAAKMFLTLVCAPTPPLSLDLVSNCLTVLPLMRASTCSVTCLGTVMFLSLDPAQWFCPLLYAPDINTDPVLPVAFFTTTFKSVGQVVKEELPHLFGRLPGKW